MSARAVHPEGCAARGSDEGRVHQFCAGPEVVACGNAPLWRTRMGAEQLCAWFRGVRVGLDVALTRLKEVTMTTKASNIACSPWRLVNLSLPLMAAAAVGCMGVDETTSLTGQSVEAQAQVEDGEQVLEDVRVPDVTRDTAYATPDEVGGFAVQGAGVYLNVVDDRAELMLYVVAPATSATFVQPTLYLTTQEGDHTATETVVIEDVTLESGDSRVYTRHGQGPLLEAVADFESLSARPL